MFVSTKLRRIASLGFDANARAFPGVWGEGLVDEGPEFSMSNPRWDNIDDDELIFYAPALARADQARSRSKRLKEHISRAIACRVWCGVRTLATLAPHKWNQNSLLHEIEQRGFLAGADANDTFEFGAQKASSWISEAQYGKLSGSLLPVHWNLHRRIDEDWLEANKEYEFGLIGALAKCIAAIEARRRDAFLTPSQLALAAIHGAVNPALFDSHYENMHSSLTVAGWSGFLIRGRSALLSPDLAARLLEVLGSSPRSYDAGASQGFDETVDFHLNLVFGSDLLRQIARECIAARCVAHISPKLRNPALILMKASAFSDARHNRGSMPGKESLGLHP